MTISKNKYYCDSSVKTDDQWKYQSLLEKELPNEPYEIIDSRSGKIYQSGSILRFHLTDNIKRFILQKAYSDWKNYFIEDVCFLSEGREILSTVSHEDYIIMPLNEDQRQNLNNKGFDFDVEWRR